MNQHELNKRLASKLGASSPKQRRKTAKQQSREAREQALSDALAAMRDARRSIPKEWLKGFDAAMSTVGKIK